jgi:hypothetical protein
VASTSDGSPRPAKNQEDQADDEHDNADAPQDGELGHDDGDDEQADAEMIIGSPGPYFGTRL